MTQVGQACACADVAAFALLTLALGLAPGCSAAEQSPKLTRAEFDEVQSHFPSPNKEDARDGYFSSERGSAIVARRLREVFSDRGISILRGTTKVETFRIADTEDLDYAFGRHKDVRSKLGMIDGYTITSNGKVADEGFAERLSGYLLHGEHYFVSFDCLPDPGVAFRAWRGRESVSLIICYECDRLKVFVHDEGGSIVHRGSSYFSNEFGESEVLTELAKEAFPEDEEIQGMGKKPVE
jgi:hypothetical protein